MSCFMKIQQRGNETLAGYVHHFKMQAKRCDFNIDTADILIFIEGLWDAHTITAKVYEKDPKPKTSSEVFKLVESLNTAPYVMATLSLPSEHDVKG